MTWFYLDDEEIRCESGLWRFVGRAADNRDPTAKKLRLRIFETLIHMGYDPRSPETKLVAKYLVRSNGFIFRCADQDENLKECVEVLAERIHSETRANRPSSVDRDESASPTSELLAAIDKMQRHIDCIKVKEERDDYSDIARDTRYE